MWCEWLKQKSGSDYTGEVINYHISENYMMLILGDLTLQRWCFHVINNE